MLITCLSRFLCNGSARLPTSIIDYKTEQYGGQILLDKIASTYRSYKAKKKGVFTVTCLEKNGSVGRYFFFLLLLLSFILFYFIHLFYFILFIYFFFYFFFFFFFLQPRTTEMHILAVIMLYQHKFCVYKGVFRMTFRRSKLGIAV